MGQKIRYDIKVSIKRGVHDWYSYNQNTAPLRPGKVEQAFQDAIQSVTDNVTRGYEHEYEGVETDEMYFAVSGPIVFCIRKVIHEP